jgi:ferredoxin--NADP+ reductase
VLRVAVIGSGPAGLYAAGALADSGTATVDVLDRLPAPFGLVRYGVAPDHPRIRSVSGTLGAILAQPAVRFLGNVEVGRDVTVAELHRHYDAIVFAHGAAVDRRLAIPGEDLPGSESATDFVAWYCGHPDHAPDRFQLDATSVAVIGVGNVAADVTRILARPVADLTGTEMPAHALAALRDSRIRDIHLVGRRGPLQTKISVKELRELGDLDDVDVLLDAAGLILDEEAERHLESDPALRRVWKIFTDWSTREPQNRSRRVHVHFLQSPLAIQGTDRVEGLLLGRNRLVSGGAVEPTGQTTVIGCQLVFRSIGYRGVPMPGTAFDAAAGVIPNDGGRVQVEVNRVPGEYVTGWIRRGPTGVIGTNKHDAHETVAALLADIPELPRAPDPDPDALPKLLADRGVQVVELAGWAAIDRAEHALGAVDGRVRATIADRADLLRAASGAG